MVGNRLVRLHWQSTLSAPRRYLHRLISASLTKGWPSCAGCHQLRQFQTRSRLLAPVVLDAVTSEGENVDISSPVPESPRQSIKFIRQFTARQRDFLSKALRVNQAGELAATLIYKAQTPPIIKSHPHLQPLMKHMYDQEAGHFETFNHLMARRRVRPTVMYPLWKIAATALGWSTAVLGREAAMACTEAVETEIGTHYNEQVRILMGMVEDMKSAGEEPGPELTDLVSTIRKIRDEELEHLDHAVENDAKQAQPYSLLTGVIRAGCRGAIWVTERT